ncbi:MAG: hypothetical protein ABEI99_04860, partial [Halobaculum sp.]
SVEGGDTLGTVVEAIAFKDENETEPVKIRWESNRYNVVGLVVKAGNKICTRPGDSSSLPDGGTAETCEGSAGPPGDGPPGDGGAGNQPADGGVGNQPAGGPASFGVRDLLSMLSALLLMGVATVALAPNELFGE